MELAKQVRPIVIIVVAKRKRTELSGIWVDRLVLRVDDICKVHDGREAIWFCLRPSCRIREDSTVHNKFSTAMFLALVSACSTVAAQDHDFPTLNSIGRFLGYGYTNGGYHTGNNGQWDAIKQRHPASSYRSSSLLYPYQAGYQPRQINRSFSMSSLPSNVVVAQPPVVPAPVKKPVGPPPEWLKKYMPGQAADASPSDPSKTEGNLELLPAPTGEPRKPPARFEDEAPSPSDNLLDEGNLLLEYDDTSFLPSKPAEVSWLPASAVNRYKR